jgi:hypothetical protein
MISAQRRQRSFPNGVWEPENGFPRVWEPEKKLGYVGTKKYFNIFIHRRFLKKLGIEPSYKNVKRFLWNYRRSEK